MLRPFTKELRRDGIAVTRQGERLDRADRASFPLIGSVDQVADSTDPLAATGLPHRMRALYRVQPTAYGNGPRRLPVRTCRSPQTPVSVGWMLNP